MFLSKKRKILFLSKLSNWFFFKAAEIIFSTKIINYVFISQPQKKKKFAKIFLIWFLPKWQNFIFRQNLKIKLFFKPQNYFFHQNWFFLIFPQKFMFLFSFETKKKKSKSPLPSPPPQKKMQIECFHQSYKNLVFL